MLIKSTGLCIKIDNVNIEKVDNTKLLGVIINDRLNWNDHIKTVCTKVNKNTGVLYRTRENLNTNTLLILYQALIQPYLEYCNIIWSVDDSDFLKKLFIKQKKAVRAKPLGNGTVILRQFLQGYKFSVYII